jgi:alpha-galactosidase
MNLDMVSDRLAFRMHLPDGSWDLRVHSPDGMSIEGARMGVTWLRRNRRKSWSGVITDPVITSIEERNASHGKCLEASVRWSKPGEGLEFNLDCSLLLEAPLFLWRLHVENSGRDPIRLKTIEMMRAGSGSRSGIQPCGSIHLHSSPGEPAFFTNGWQSWGYTGTLGRDDRFPRTRFGPLTRPMRVNAGTPRPSAPGHFASDMFAAIGDRRWRQGFVLGFLSERQAFGSLEAELDAVEPRLRLWANADDTSVDPGESFITDWACLQPFDIDDADPLGPYLNAVARENAARSAGIVPVGWCSWYQFFDAVAHEDVMENLEWAAEQRRHIPFNLIQIDDGYQAQVGDWFQSKQSFPQGVVGIAQRAKKEGFTPGLWLAPLIVRPEARILKDHPDWLLRRRGGRPVQAGFIWNRFTRALDPTHPEVIEHLQQLIQTAIGEWGFEYLKLDFLYAGALAGVRHNRKMTRAQALRHALLAMREAAGDDVYMLGCGCPLGSGIGIFDAMRIGADVAPTWHPAYLGMKLPFKKEPDFPAARNAIRNTITRAPMHRRLWVNDPDCLLMRGTDTELSEYEVQTLATTIALSAGSLIVSDDLPSLDKNRIQWLAKLIPPLIRQARAIDWFDESHPARLVLPISDESGERDVVALLNWHDAPRMVRLALDEFGLSSAEAYHAVDFWRARYMYVEPEAEIGLEIPAHGVRLLALRPLQDRVEWIGDTLHISQGMAVKRWNEERSAVGIDLALGRQAEGTIWIAIPTHPALATLDGKPLEWREAAEGVYEFDVAFDGKASMAIRLP